MSWWWGAALLCACAVASEDKRAEMAPLPFVLGSRYGRSQPAPRLLAPRNDRFFMGSRYGKRSEPMPGPEGLQPALSALAGSAAAGARGSLGGWGGRGGGGGGGRGGGGGGGRGGVLCEYTGLGALFRCERAPPYDRRSSDEGDED